MFTLSKGVFEPWITIMLVFTVSKNTQILCIAHPFVISPEHDKKNPI
jgi:hypothetical protein